MNPDNTVFDAKRLIGRRFEDASVQSDMKHWPFDVVSDGGKPKIVVEYKNEKKTFYPEEISSMVLVKMKEIAEAYLGKVLFQFFINITFVDLSERGYFYTVLLIWICRSIYGCMAAN